MVKPVDFARFLKAALRAQTALSAAQATQAPLGKPADHLFVKVNGQHVRFEQADIAYVEASGNYVQLTDVQGKTEQVYATLNLLEERLDPALFLRIHRSFLVNLRAVAVVEEEFVVVGKKAIPISKARRRELQERLNLL